jgi:hypothetical protein
LLIRWLRSHAVFFLFSQHQQWINLTVHNLCELALLPKLFGLCCFSMRFFVLLDLIGTIVGSLLYFFFLFTDHRCSRRYCQPLSSKSVFPEQFYSNILSNSSLACLFGHHGIHTCICVPLDCYYHVGSNLRFASE